MSTLERSVDILVISALRTLDTNIGRSAVALLQSPQPPPIETILSELINTLTQLPHDVVLVLDDYHVITSPAIHHAVAFLLDHLPSQLHLVITSRIDPVLPLARLRARGEVVELRAADLRFTPDEATAFLREVADLVQCLPDARLACAGRSRRGRSMGRPDSRVGCSRDAVICT